MIDRETGNSSFEMAREERTEGGKEDRHREEGSCGSTVKTNEDSLVVFGRGQLSDGHVGEA